MSGNIFPVKLTSFYMAMRDTGVLEKLVHETQQYGLVHDDDKVRILLRSPEVLRAVRGKHKVQDLRVRIAFPVNETFLELTEHTMLEVRGSDGALLADPTKVTELDETLGNAVQVELLQLLLKAKGLEIPTM